MRKPFIFTFIACLVLVLPSCSKKSTGPADASVVVLHWGDWVRPCSSGASTYYVEMKNIGNKTAYNVTGVFETPGGDVTAPWGTIEPGKFGISYACVGDSIRRVYAIWDE